MNLHSFDYGGKTYWDIVNIAPLNLWTCCYGNYKLTSVCPDFEFVKVKHDYTDYLHMFTLKFYYDRCHKKFKGEIITTKT